MGYSLSKEEMEKTYERFLAVADKKTEVFDEDLAAIISDEIHLIEQTYELLHLHVVIDTDTAPKAIVSSYGENTLRVTAVSPDAGK